MSVGAKRNSFGTKGANRTYAEQLLSGGGPERGRRKPPPSLKPRARAKFGRKSTIDQTSQPTDPGHKRWGWKGWMAATLMALVAMDGLSGVMDWPSPTLGGRQLWTDVRVQDGWRAQCHAWTGHCRLLDSHDVRRTWGDEAHVLRAMDAAIASGNISAPRAHAVVLVHGLGRSGHSFDGLATVLRDAGLEVVTFNYASTQGTIHEHAQALNRVVAGLKGVRRVSFVTHSLGGVVLRQALNMDAPWRAEKGLGAAVLLAPPNQGSSLARTLKAVAPARWVFGPTLAELADANLGQRLPLPLRFAIVAGANNRLGLIDGEGDGLVRVAETRLDGAAQQTTVAAGHTFIMDAAPVRAFVTGFIAGQ